MGAFIIKYRWFGVLLLTLTMLGGVYFSSAIFGFFNSGASKLDIYHADERYFEKARPFIFWRKDDPNLEGKINEYLREDIAQAYFQGVRALNLSQELNENVALKEHFTVPLIKKILKGISEKDFDFSQVNLSHNLNIHFVSLDKTVVSFTDVQSRIKQKIGNRFEDGLMAYKVNMVLQDGRWRIDAMEQTDPLLYVYVDQVGNTTYNEIGKGRVGINYYPAEGPWQKFWMEYDTSVIADDLTLMKELNFKAVRFFIPFELFGGGLVDLRMIQKLDHFVNLAEKRGLKLIPTMFDFPVGYELKNYPQYDRHLEFILKRYRDRSAILLWDLKNEVDLDFENQGKENTLEWMNFIIERARSYTDKPLTVGWSNYRNADLICDGLDVVSFHYYEEPEKFREVLQRVKGFCNKPILLSEYGMSTYDGLWPGGNSEINQKNYFAEMDLILEQENVEGFAWCLYDYENAPSSVFGWKPWIRAKQKKFGIIRLDGSQKLLLQH